MAYPTFSAGQALPASDMNAIGLWLVKTQTVGTGVSSVTVTSAFSADFDNYKIIYTGGTGSVAQIDLQFQLGSTTTNYTYALFYIVPPSSTISQLSSTSASNYPYAGGLTTNGGGIEMDVFSPNLAKYTYLRNTYLRDDVLGATGTGSQKSTTQFTSFVITPNTGTLTGGTIRVYGYRN